jgi:hypothetical protein
VRCLTEPMRRENNPRFPAAGLGLLLILFFENEFTIKHSIRRKKNRATKFSGSIFQRFIRSD